MVGTLTSSQRSQCARGTMSDSCCLRPRCGGHR
jgi:hypothetical protein